MLLVTLAALVGLGSLVRAWPAIRETSLVHPWAWAVAACSAALAEVGALKSGWLDPHGRFAEPVAYGVACLSLAPGLSVLGAKQPHGRGWNWVVASAWAIMVLPAAYSMFAPTVERLTIFPAMQWLLLAAISLQAANYLPTRLAIAAILTAAGQTLLLAQRLPAGEALFASIHPQTARGWGAIALATATVVAVLVLERPESAATPTDRLWQAFRDRFGMLWALRVQEQWNDSAVHGNWSKRLVWSGFVDATSETSSNVEKNNSSSQVDEAAGERVLRSMLRRFVSQEWIGQRLNRSID